MDFKKIFSERLILLRKNANMSKKTLGELLGISDAAVTMLEKSKRSPSFEVLCNISTVFNVSVDYFIGLFENPQINK